jgi:hypothetical protein
LVRSFVFSFSMFLFHAAMPIDPVFVLLSFDFSDLPGTRFDA